MSAPAPKTALPRLAQWLIARLAPSEWRESIAGDVEEERARRIARGQRAGTLWTTVTAGAIAWRLRRDRHLTQITGTRRDAGWIAGWSADLRQALRSLAAHRGYSLAVIATLALGIGANVTIFNFANWLLFRPLPGVADESRLVTVGFGTADGTRLPIPAPDLPTLRSSTPGLTSLSGFQTFNAHVTGPDGSARRVTAEVVTGNYFDVLGGPLRRGRSFSAVEGADRSAPPVVVVSDRLARQLLGDDAALPGQTIAINRVTVQVIGVATRGFYGTSLTSSTDVWIPEPQFRLAALNYPETMLTNRRIGLYYALMGRLAPGASPETIGAQMEATRASIAAADPGDRRIARFRFVVDGGARSNGWQRGVLSEAFTILLGMVALLLVVTCANAGQIMLTRATARRQEIAIRLSLGASRAGIVRLLLAESVLLSLAAGVVAIAIAWIVAALAQGTVVLRGAPPLDRSELDWRVLGWALGISMVVAALAGVLPALVTSRAGASGALRDEGRSHTATRPYLRRALAASQVALSLALVIGALLLTRSMAARLSIDPGFDPSRMVTFAIDPASQRYGAERPAVLSELTSRLREVPGVRSVALSWLRPSFQGVGSDTNFTLDPADDRKFGSDTNRVTPGFFDAIGLPIVEGRDFAASESGIMADAACSCALMTESLARQVFGGGPAAGRQILGVAKSPTTIVGVVRDTRQRRLTAGAPDMIFLPYRPSTGDVWTTVVVGLSGTAETVIPLLRRAVSDVDPTLPIYDLLRGDEGLRAQFAEEDLLMRLALVFAALASVVAAIGLAGVLSRTIADRRRELAIRAALGATPRGLAGLMLTESAAMLVAGSLAGSGVSWWLSSYLTSKIYGVTAHDPLSFLAGIAIVSVLLILVTLPAAHRAGRLDPLAAMRP